MDHCKVHGFQGELRHLSTAVHFQDDRNCIPTATTRYSDIGLVRQRIDFNVIDQNLIGRNSEHRCNFLVHSLDFKVRRYSKRFCVLSRYRNHGALQ
jgi:hypothetical protein